MRIISCVFILLYSLNCFSFTREIAITIDDLPLVASRMNTPGNIQRSTERFMNIIKVLQDNKVPATGFVIAGAIEKGQWDFLEAFRQAGFMLGNHTYKHRSLGQVSAETYIADIEKADKILAPILTEPKYFRYPYLAEGSGEKKQKVSDYLAANHYTIARVTVDSKDFEFNERLYKVPFRSREQYIQKMKSGYLAYIWKATLKAEKKAEDKPVKQILLIHANLLNSYVLDDIIQMYKKNGYTFISLTDALKNPAPGIVYPSSDEKNNPRKSSCQCNESV